MFYWLLKIILGPLVKAIWIKRVVGIKNLPKKDPIIIAANHSSYFDFLSLIAVFPRRIHFLAAEVFYKSPFWKPIVVLTGQIKIDRKKKDKSGTINKVNKALREGQIIGIFPEGTRSRSGKLQRAYTGVAKFSLENKVNILPVSIRGTYYIMAPKDKKPKFNKIIEINILPIIEYENIKNYKPEYITHNILMHEIANNLGQDYPGDK